MEFSKVIKHRKMVRSFIDKPIPETTLNQIINSIFTGPSAGFSQGTEILVLRNAKNKEIFYSQWGDKEDRKNYRQKWPNLENAAVIIVFFANSQRYIQRYSRDDKGGKNEKEQNWRIPWWYVDTGMATLLGLLSAVDLNLGAAFTRVSKPDYLRDQFEIPKEYDPIGAMLLGYPTKEQRMSKSAKLGRRSIDETTHFEKW